MNHATAAAKGEVGLKDTFHGARPYLSAREVDEVVHDIEAGNVDRIQKVIRFCELTIKDYGLRLSPSGIACAGLSSRGVQNLQYALAMEHELLASLNRRLDAIRAAAATSTAPAATEAA